ncbi:hypothetical protein Poly41_57670 [Novipirellula artificiosorum]|uniref:DUF1559 domain-containing protein n=2 Tax=Novipirellula artificiosorum TaxID=2528016 RepID=A0A5C6D5P8_9BACT|nr:hypothetical protein Poly41_57670 [Novipirellula artificiosorum]
MLYAESLQAMPWHRAGFANAGDLLIREDEDDVQYPIAARFTQGMVWHYEDDERSDGASKVAPVHRIATVDSVTNRMTPSNASDLARPSSAHQNGFNAAMADGGTRFISSTIDYRVYQALLTPSGKHADVPNRAYVLSEESF